MSSCKPSYLQNPHFMEKTAEEKTYKSKKVIGKMNDDSKTLAREDSLLLEFKID